MFDPVSVVFLLFFPIKCCLRAAAQELEAVFHTEMQRIDYNVQTPLQLARLLDLIEPFKVFIMVVFGCISGLRASNALLFKGFRCKKEKRRGSGVDERIDDEFDESIALEAGHQAGLTKRRRVLVGIYG